MLDLAPDFDIKPDPFILQPTSDINPKVQVPQIQKFCKIIKQIHPINPAFPCHYPEFVNTEKFNKLISRIIPENCVNTSDKSYSSIISSNKRPDKPTKSTITTITFNNIYPGFILGGGPNKIAKPSYIIADGKYQFQKYHKDISRSYINVSIPRCNVCRKPGITYSNCQRCKNEMDKIRDEIKAKGKAEKWTVKLINKKIGDVQIPSVCNKCSRVGHKWVICNQRPYCYLCALSHNVGDVRYCLLMQSIYIMLENIWAIHHSGGDPKEFSNWQLLTYKPTDDVPQAIVPPALQREIPLLISKSTDSIKKKTKPLINKQTDKELYENALPGSAQNDQIHPSLKENDYPDDSDDDVIKDIEEMIQTPKEVHVTKSQPQIPTKQTENRPPPRRSRRNRSRPKPQPKNQHRPRYNEESSPSNTSRSRSRSQKHRNVSK